jgi:predicted phosphodiesterase
VLRVAFTSDIHVDHHPEVIARVASRARALEADVLIVAGDLTPHLDRLAEALRGLRQGAERVLFLAGNHDLWSVGDGPDSKARYLDLIPGVCARAGVDCLHHDTIDIDGVTFVGQTGWYDYSLRDPEHAEAIPIDAYASGRFGKLFWSDKRFVRWPGLTRQDGSLDDAALADTMSARLATSLDHVAADRRVVVVTHMLPFDELAPSRPLPWGFVRGFLGARSLGDAMIACARRGTRITHAIAGHTHFARRAEVTAGSRTIAAETSPIGYPREYGRFGLDLATHVDKRVRLVEIGAET